MQQGHALLACSLMLAHLDHVMFKGISTKVSFFPQRNLIKLEYHHNTHPPPHTHHTCILVNLLRLTKHTKMLKKRLFISNHQNEAVCRILNNQQNDAARREP